MTCTEITTTDPDRTEALGAAIAQILQPGDIVLLRGELGAGKTTLVRGAARALGVHGPVTSPTFTIANIYAGRLPVAHLDAWRLSGADDEEIGLALEAIRDDGVAFVEWPDAIAAALPDPRVTVNIAHGDRRTRVLRISAADEATHAALEERLDHLRA